MISSHVSLPCSIWEQPISLSFVCVCFSLVYCRISSFVFCHHLQDRVEHRVCFHLLHDIRRVSIRHLMKCHLMLIVVHQRGYLKTKLEHDNTLSLLILPSRCSAISLTSLMVSSCWTSSVNVRSSKVRTKICIILLAVAFEKRNDLQWTIKEIVSKKTKKYSKVIVNWIKEIGNYDYDNHTKDNEKIPPKWFLFVLGFVQSCLIADWDFFSWLCR